MIPKQNDIVTLKDEGTLLKILRNLDWNGDDENRIEAAKILGDKQVVVDNPQDHHEYFFSNLGWTVHYSMIKNINIL